MNLAEEFVLTGVLGAPRAIGNVAAGTRLYYPVVGGAIVGERLNAKIIDGGEWALVEKSGLVRVDVRLQSQTNDGAHLYIQYLGLIKLPKLAQAAVAAGRATTFEDQYFYTNPRIETGDDKYQWLNETFFVGEGRFLENQRVEYRVYRPD